jgi:Lon protease-like protein
MLPETIPIFPLPNVVLFPNVFLPLHIFEPRYRDMVRDALAGERLIGMVLLKPGWQGHYEERPAVYPIGCAGVVTHSEPLADGRFHIILRGVEKFRILSEEPPATSYRIARVDSMDESLAEGDRDAVQQARQRLELLLKPTVPQGGAGAQLPSAMSDEDLVNVLSQYLEWEPVEKQALLERAGLLDRCHGLIELLEMKVLVSKNAAGAWKPS